MASPYSQVLMNLQENAQAGVPLTPANGNPGGAHNMPGANQPVQQAVPKPMLASPFLQYSAANPSPFMQGIMAMLAPARPAAPAIPADIPVPSTQQLPVLPIRRAVP